MGDHLHISDRKISEDHPCIWARRALVIFDHPYNGGYSRPSSVVLAATAGGCGQVRTGRAWARASPAGPGGTGAGRRRSARRAPGHPLARWRSGAASRLRLARPVAPASGTVKLSSRPGIPSFQALPAGRTRFAGHRIRGAWAASGCNTLGPCRVTAGGRGGHHATGPRRSMKIPVGPSGPMVARLTIESVPSVTVSWPV
jgi:hypothetical protein